MEPPRTRTPRIDFSNTETLRALVLNTTAAIVTLMLVRVATLLVSDSSDATLPESIQTITEPLVWLFKFIPGLGATLVNELTVIDILIIPVIAIAGLLITGILTGWRESATRPRHEPRLRE